ncbi:hypothetical protein G7Y89_g14405 [Cudoniella acicularis]|uniref:Transcription factor domain-containing protein n=1 Tax=Cudoniella acicularis TaxID=354080 RepID=A0A8H4VT97_9HELO|nr:hypothetical protein G7Y89_g14405 [Cudoniella acicularis]
MQKLESLHPESVILRWDEASLELSLLYLSIVLLTTSPPSSPEDDSSPSEFKSLYFCIKSWISLIEGFGVNTLEILQARILVTLFEVTHGFYPAAHISIGSVVRAADTLATYPAAKRSLSYYPSDKAEQEEDILTWCGITTLDRCVQAKTIYHKLIYHRYIAIESSSYAPLTRSYTHPTWTPIEPYLYPPHTVGQDRAAPLGLFSRLFESCSLLDKFQTTRYDPTSEHLFNIEHLLKIEEIIRLVKTANSLKTILYREILEGREIYSSALAICDIGLLLAFKDGCKMTPVDEITSKCLSVAVKFLDFLLSSIVNKVEPFALGTQPLDFDLLPPSIMFLVYKTAALVTERLWVDSEFERYLQILNEDMTPRILKAVEEG